MVLHWKMGLIMLHFPLSKLWFMWMEKEEINLNVLSRSPNDFGHVRLIPLFQAWDFFSRHTLSTFYKSSFCENNIVKGTSFSPWTWNQNAA